MGTHNICFCAEIRKMFVWLFHLSWAMLLHLRFVLYRHLLNNSMPANIIFMQVRLENYQGIKQLVCLPNVNPCHAELIKMPCPLLIVSQSGCLIQVFDTNPYTN